MAACAINVCHSVPYKRDELPAVAAVPAVPPPCLSIPRFTFHPTTLPHWPFTLSPLAQCLFKAIAICKPGTRYREIGDGITKHATSQG